MGNKGYGRLVNCLSIEGMSRQTQKLKLWGFGLFFHPMWHVGDYIDDMLRRLGDQGIARSIDVLLRHTLHKRIDDSCNENSSVLQVSEFSQVSSLKQVLLSCFHQGSIKKPWNLQILVNKDFSMKNLFRKMKTKLGISTENGEIPLG